MRVIFIRKPKCAGTSIVRTLKHAVRIRNVEDWEPGQPCDALWIGGGVARWYRNDDWFRRTWKFCVCRNVWARAVSAWKYKLSDKPFAEVVRRPPQSRDWASWHHFTRPQADFILDYEGRLLVDYVVDFDHLVKRFKPVWEKLGLRKIPRLRHCNSTPHEHHYSYYFDRKTKAIFDEKFATDIELMSRLLPKHRFERVEWPK